MRIRILSLLLLLFPALCQTQWVHCGPQGGKVTSFVTMGRAIFASTTHGDFGLPGSGVFRSLDSGSSWATLNKGLLDTNVVTMATEGSILFASTESLQLYRSFDSGVNWELLPKSRIINPFSSFASASTSLFGVSNGTIFESADTGRSWNRVLSLTPLAFHLCAIDSILFVSTVTRADSLYRSSDRGVTWKAVHADILDITSIDKKLYASSINTILESTDLGSTWNTVKTVYDQGHYDAFSSAGSVLFASRTQGVGVGHLSSRVWVADSTLPYFDAVGAIGPYLFAATYKGIFRSFGKGTDWKLMIDGLYPFHVGMVHYVNPLISFGEKLIAVSNFLSEVSLDRGLTWSVDSFLTNNQVNSITNFGTSLFATIYGGPKRIAGTYLSKDGVTWKLLDSQYVPMFIVPVGSALFASVYDQGILRSLDSGVTWYDANNGFRDNFRQLTSFSSDGAMLYAGLTASEISDLYRSSDNGESWFNLTMGLVDTAITAIAADGKYIVAAEGTHMLRSSDGGTNWMRIETGRYIQAFLLLNHVLFAGTRSGVFVTSDMGLNWRPENKETEGRAVSCFAILDGDLYAGSSNGVWRRALSTFPELTSGSVAPVLEKEEIAITPNPAHSFLSIRSPRAVHHVSVMNVLGQTVEERSYRDVRDLTLDLSRMAPGTYYMRIETSERSEMRRFVKE